MLVGLQLLRFFAAFLVIFSHVLGEYPSFINIGTFGVDIFFVISGFIIYHITHDGVDNFISRRLIRIVPMYWLFTIGIAIIAYFQPNLLRSVEFDFAHFIASMLFIPYWTPGSEHSPILMLGWTLNYEMMFYLLFYTCARVSHMFRGLLTSTVIIAFFFVSNLIKIDDRSALWFYSDGIILEFVAGMFVGWIFKNWKFNSNSVALFLFTTSLGFLIYSDIKDQFGIDRFLVWGLPSMIIVIATLMSEEYFSSFKQNAKNMFLWLGEMSYPAYLLHIYVIALFSRLIFPDVSIATLLCVSLGVTLLLCSFVSNYFDKRIRSALSRGL